MLNNFKAELNNDLNAREDRFIEDGLLDLITGKVEEQMGELEECVMGKHYLEASASFFDIRLTIDCTNDYANAPENETSING
jgi:hypothetical protein